MARNSLTSMLEQWSQRSNRNRLAALLHSARAKNHEGLDSASCTFAFAREMSLNIKVGVSFEAYYMRTSPRRKDRTINDPRKTEALLDRMPVGRLGLSTKDGPYVVPVNYVFAEGCIYFHSGREGRKMEALQADPCVCFLVDDPGPQVTWEQGCGITQIYESVMCFGKAELVQDIAERRRILEMLIEKYVSDDNRVPILDGNVENTAVVRIRIEWMTGKANRISSLHRKVSNRFLPA